MDSKKLTDLAKSIQSDLEKMSSVEIETLEKAVAAPKIAGASAAPAGQSPAKPPQAPKAPAMPKIATAAKKNPAAPANPGIMKADDKIAAPKSDVGAKTDKLKQLLGKPGKKEIKGKLDVNAHNALVKLGHTPVYKSEEQKPVLPTDLLELAKHIEDELRTLPEADLLTLEKSMSESGFEDLAKAVEKGKKLPETGNEADIKDNQPTAPEYVSRGQKAKKWGEKDIPQNSNEQQWMPNTIAKDESCIANDPSLKKDNQPHPPGSPEDSAHDVMEEGASMFDEIKHLPYAEQKEIFLNHLRSLKDAGQERSPENQEVGQDQPMVKYEDAKAEFLAKAREEEHHMDGTKRYIRSTRHREAPKKRDPLSNNAAPAAKLRGGHIEHAKRDHKETLSDLKRQKPLNLPKAEMEKARQDEGMSPKLKAHARSDRNDRHADTSAWAKKDAMRFALTGGDQAGQKGQKIQGSPKAPEGVHQAIPEKPKGGISERGLATRSKNMEKSSSHKGSVRPADGDKFKSKLQSKLGKELKALKGAHNVDSFSELLEKDPEAAGKWNGRPKQKLGKDSEYSRLQSASPKSQFEQGVHNAVIDRTAAYRDQIGSDTTQESLMGKRVRAGKLDEAKKIAAGTLREIKGMSKPNLGKDEHQPHPGPSKPAWLKPKPGHEDKRPAYDWKKDKGPAPKGDKARADARIAGAKVADHPAPKKLDKGDAIDMKTRKVISSTPTKETAPASRKVSDATGQDYVVPLNPRDAKTLRSKNIEHQAAPQPVKAKAKRKA